MHEHTHDEDVKHPMAAHLYDQMEAEGYDMSRWFRYVSPNSKPGDPQWITRNYTNRAMRRAAQREGRTKTR